MRHDYEKRRFIEMCSVSMATGRSTANPMQQIHVRDIVNKAGELWDEIEHQCPRPKEKDYNE